MDVGGVLLVRLGIAPSEHALELLVGPRIEVYGFDPTDVRAHSTMDSGAPAIA